MLYIANENKHSDYLVHYGTKNMKWGVRNYQNYDGTLTAAGKVRYTDTKKNKAKAAQTNAISDYNWDSGRDVSQRRNCWKFADDARSKGYNVYDIKTDRVNEEEIKRWIADSGEYVNDEKAFEEYIKNTIRPNFGDEFADIYRNAMLEATKKAKPQNKVISGMPTSEIKKKESADAESKIKNNIPASAWNQRAGKSTYVTKDFAKGHMYADAVINNYRKKNGFDSWLKDTFGGWDSYVNEQRKGNKYSKWAGQSSSNRLGMPSYVKKK